MSIYRRRQQGRPSWTEIEIDSKDDDVDADKTSSSLATKAIRASSAAHRDSSLSSAYALDTSSPPAASAAANYSHSRVKDSNTISKLNDYTSLKSLNDPKHGFWGSLARKAKAFLEDDYSPQQSHSSDRTRRRTLDSATASKQHNPNHSHEGQPKVDSPTLQKGLGAITSSLNYIGTAVEEGLSKVENRTAEIIQDTRKHLRKKSSDFAAQNQGQAMNCSGIRLQPQMETNQELQLKASRDVAMAMAAKAKLLLRELKTVKADLAFAKERCAQLEEENRFLRENRQQGDSPEDDDLVRLQLETLLAEKARLAHENSIYARENRFLREVVEYHQLTMQDVVYLDEGTEEVTEVYPIKVVSNTPSIPSTLLSSSSSLPSNGSLHTNLQKTRDILPYASTSSDFAEGSQSAAPPSS
ncbi:hypothetical protein HS088_TW07G00001 [Tripterygium wilfordii]|uniref:Uncharacterized protein n=1 Tax=Tripterygium wilfordii TaxID=458696 RepID=A0A7J7DDJ3_TRIWF|nr:uncharacterized protein LOC120003106 [Tripterygium wilfordii]KAF5744430.1 hypothetical protein HS088_TW07G00001 [Tripterygium wilfordii]